MSLSSLMMLPPYLTVHQASTPPNASPNKATKLLPPQQLSVLVLLLPARLTKLRVKCRLRQSSCSPKPTATRKSKSICASVVMEEL